MQTPTHCVRHSLAYTEPPDRVEGANKTEFLDWHEWDFP